jgi:hypothetical protein
VRLRHDRVRDRWLLLGPERGYVLNASALAIVQRLDGRTTRAIAGALGGPLNDVIALVEELARRGLVQV